MLKKVYIDICNNFRHFLVIEYKLRNKKYNKIISKIKYNIYTKFNIIKNMNYDNNRMYIIYNQKNIDYKTNEKIKKLIKKIGNKEIIISNQLKKNLNIIEDKNKSVFINKLEDTLKYIMNLKNEEAMEQNIYFLINKYNVKYKNIIQLLAKHFKSLNIVTYNIEEFKKLEDETYKKYDAYITISNNKRKSLSKAEYIINLDYDENMINGYNVKRNAIILNISEYKLRNIVGFGGVIINNIKIKRKIHKKFTYLTIRFPEYKKEELKDLDICELEGNNSTISEYELL